MKAGLYDRIRTLVDVNGVIRRGTVIPKGSEGTIVECYTFLQEGYAVDFAFPDESLASGVTFDNVTLFPEQFEVIRTHSDR